MSSPDSPLSKLLDLLSSLKFITLLGGALYLILKQFNPNLPFTTEGFITFLVTVLALFGVHAEARYRVLVRELNERGLITRSRLL